MSCKYGSLLNFIFSGVFLITKASCQAWLKLLIANEVRIGGPGGGGSQRDHFEAVPQPFGVAMVVVFEAYVPGGNWVTVGFDSPLVHPSPSWAPSINVHWGRRSKHKKSNGRTRKVSVFVEPDVFCTITCLFIFLHVTTRFLQNNLLSRPWGEGVVGRSVNCYKCILRKPAVKLG